MRDKPANFTDDAAVFHSTKVIITARKRSLRRLCGSQVSVMSTKGGVLSQHSLQVVSQHALQQVSLGGGGHTQTTSLTGQTRGGVSRSTPRGEVEESGLRGVSPGPHLRGSWGSPGLHPGGLQAHTIWKVSRPTPRGWVSQHALRQTPLATAICTQPRYTSY